MISEEHLFNLKNGDELILSKSPSKDCVFSVGEVFYFMYWIGENRIQFSRERSGFEYWFTKNESMECFDDISYTRDQKINLLINI